MLPVHDEKGELWSLQFISGCGDKKFLGGGRAAGGFYRLGKAGKRIFICEGFATAASIREATEDCVVAAFNCGNLLPVAKIIRKQCPNAELIIAAADRWKDGNPGLTKATAAAKATGARIVKPRFSDPQLQVTDFNDLRCLEGIAKVKEQLKACVPATGEAPHSPIEPDPEPPLVFPKNAWRGTFADYRATMRLTTEASESAHFSTLWAVVAARLGRRARVRMATESAK